MTIAARPARAHDPFEITTDAHVSGDRLGLHTTMSLLTAARLCFQGTGARRTIDVPELASLWPALEDCITCLPAGQPGRGASPPAGP